MAYQYLDSIMDLTLQERQTSRALAFVQAGPNLGGYELVTGEWQSGHLVSSELDIYRVSLTAGATVTVESHSARRSLLIVYDEAGKAVEAVEPGYGDFTRLTFVVPRTGAYYVDAGWNGAMFIDSRIEISVDFKAPGFLGNDFLQGSQAFAGPGQDLVWGTAGADYLRGDEGNDQLDGFDGNDDLNGNMGDDTVSGGTGDDWVLGGKDNDSLSGGMGNDLVYGNLGADVCDGGSGDDTLRGGQADDLIDAGGGDDWLSGDRGDDTLIGGLSRDIFHTFGDAGLDMVMDFGAFDRVQLDPGTQYDVAQVGADTVITMAGGGRMILVNVILADLPAGWIFVG